MKLYLSSYKIGNKTNELKKWLENSDNNNVALISNSRDIYPDGEIKTTGIKNDAKELENLGFNVKYLDLREYFEKKENLIKDLQDVKAFYIIGGNTFVLRKAMYLSGFDELLLDYASDQSYLYAGYSAGICVLCKDMKVLAMMDDPEADPYNSNMSPIYKGVGLVEEVLIPHYKSDHKETEVASKTVEFCKKNNIRYKALCDGDVMIKEIIC